MCVPGPEPSPAPQTQIPMASLTLGHLMEIWKSINMPPAALRSRLCHCSAHCFPLLQWPSSILCTTKGLRLLPTLLLLTHLRLDGCSSHLVALPALPRSPKSSVQQWFFLLNALSKGNSHTILVTRLKCAITVAFDISLELCSHHHSQFRTFLSPQKTPPSLRVTLHSSLPQLSNS